jgi:uncharacterized protein YbjT (DUF2867 family)
VRVLALGGTGSVGRWVVTEALEAGHEVVALVRDVDRARAVLPSEVRFVEGDLTTGARIAEAVRDVEAIVATLDGDARLVDFGGMLRVLRAIRDRRVHLVIMSAIGVANVGQGDLLDWKRRGERLVRASGHDFTIARPGWFDMQSADHQSLHLFQGEQRWSMTPDVGVVGRQQIARVLVGALSSPESKGKTFDLVAEVGPAQDELDPLFAALEADDPRTADCWWDPDNMPLADEPAQVLHALAELSTPRVDPDHGVARGISHSTEEPNS